MSSGTQLDTVEKLKIWTSRTPFGAVPLQRAIWAALVKPHDLSKVSFPISKVGTMVFSQNTTLLRICKPYPKESKFISVHW